MVYKFFDKKIKIEIMPNQHLAKELHKPIIRKFEKWKVHSSFIYNIWGADLADMQLLSKCNKRLIYVSDIVNMRGFFLWKIKRVLQLLMLSNKY